jgi:MoxR-like ATPase
MKRIVRVHHPHVDDALVDQAVEAFYELRSVPRVRKPPSTSELVDWITVLLHAGVGRERLASELPFLGVLLKKEDDIDAVRDSLRDVAPLHSIGQLTATKRR